MKYNPQQFIEETERSVKAGISIQISNAFKLGWNHGLDRNPDYPSEMLKKYEDFIVKEFRSRLLALLEARDNQWIELLKKSHPSVLTQLKGEIALKKLLLNHEEK